MSDRIVNICMITYNQEIFISQAIDSILDQKTDFDYQLVIGEDCSKDDTRKICEDYARKYPQKIKLLPSNENLGMTNNFIRTLKACNSKYIAFCEGDDYWTDPLKLQTQVDFLEKNLDCAGCFHDVSNVDGNNKVIKENYYEPKQERYNLKDCLTHLGSRYATCSVMFRNSVLDGEWPTWFKLRACDEFLDLMIAKKGLLAYIPKNMGMYRIHQGGIWQGDNYYGRLKDAIYRKELLYKDEYFKLNHNGYLRSGLVEHIQYVLFYKELSLPESFKYYFKMFKYIKLGSFKSLVTLLDSLGVTLFKKSFIGVLKKKGHLSKAY